MLLAASRATTVACVAVPVVRLESVALTLTDATDGGETVNLNVAGPTPSTVTPIVLLPAATAVTSPDAETVATPGALLVHTTVRPLSGTMLLAASRATTAACVVVPLVRLESAAVTLTAATGMGATMRVNVAGPTPSTVTPIVAVPSPSAVITPEVEIVATAGVLLVQTTVRPESGRMLLAASRATTVAWTTSPIVRLESGALRATDATGIGETVSPNVAGPTPSTVTAIVTVPGETAVTTPDVDTVATAGELLVHATVRPVSDKTLFAESRAMAVAWTVVPTVMLESAADTVTDRTGTGATRRRKVAGPTPPIETPIVVCPTATAVTRPAEFTVPTLGSALTQVASRPANGFPASVPIALPAESLAVGIRSCVCDGRSVAEVGATATDETGTRSLLIVIVSATTPLTPGALAMIIKPPAGAPSAVIVVMPLLVNAGVTCSLAGSLVDQLICRPGSELLFASNACAVTCRAYRLPT
jgi:hypothetical protein